MLRAAGHVRRYATQPPRPSGKARPFLLLTGVVVFSFFAVDYANKSLDKAFRNNLFSEKEYSRMQNGLVRRIREFSPEQLPEVYLVPDLKSSRVDKYVKSLANARVVDVDALVERARSNLDSPLALLIEELAQNGKLANRDFPAGFLFALVRLEIRRQAAHGTDPVVVVGYPTNVKEAARFEDEVAGVSKLVVFGHEGEGLVDDAKDNADRAFRELVGYYLIVDKLERR